MFLGLSGMGKVLYSALNFNDCQEDAKLLAEEIVDAKQDLSKRGLKFVSSNKWSNNKLYLSLI